MAVTITRAELYALVDRLPDEMLGKAARYLQGLTTTDPLLRKFLLAPLDDEPLTPEEEAGIAEGEAEMARGGTIPWEEVEAHFFRPNNAVASARRPARREGSCPRAARGPREDPLSAPTDAH